MSLDTPDMALLKELSAMSTEGPLPAESLAKALSEPPFVAIPGCLNLRDVGAFAPNLVAPGKVFRSGTLDFMPPAARSLLRSQLGIQTIYDFRRNDEVRNPVVNDDDGPVVARYPYMDSKREPNSIVPAEFAPTADSKFGIGWRKMYDDVLDGYTTGYRKLFEGIRDLGDGEAVLFHCTAGKDRTGVAAALVLELMGATAEVISLEYALTRIGVEPFREKLQPLAIKGLGGIADATQTDLAEIAQRPGVRQLLSIDADAMADFMGYFKEKHGSSESYLKNKLGLSDMDIEKIKIQLSPA